MSNSVAEFERIAKEKLKQWFRHKTPENLQHLTKATKDWMRAERAQEDRERAA